MPLPKPLEYRVWRLALFHSSVRIRERIFNIYLQSNLESASWSSFSVIPSVFPAPSSHVPSRFFFLDFHLFLSLSRDFSFKIINIRGVFIIRLYYPSFLQ